VDEVRRRPDDELCGHVALDGEQWAALTVFGVALGRHRERGDAVEQVLVEGLAALADRWTLRDCSTGHEQVVCIQEASRDSVTMALDYYALPGVPTLTITSQQLASGEWEPACI
jgi:hypothetical protein